MTETEKMLREMNGFLRLVGDEPVNVPDPGASTSELAFLRQVKQEYTRRLLQKVPKYRKLKSDALIPDLFLMALRNREAELEAGKV
jgi:hypothetical protein